MLINADPHVECCCMLHWFKIKHEQQCTAHAWWINTDQPLINWLTRDVYSDTFIRNLCFTRHAFCWSQLSYDIYRICGVYTKCPHLVNKRDNIICSVPTLHHHKSQGWVDLRSVFWAGHFLSHWKNSLPLLLPLFCQIENDNSLGCG